MKEQHSSAYTFKKHFLALDKYTEQSIDIHILCVSQLWSCLFRVVSCNNRHFHFMRLRDMYVYANMKTIVTAKQQKMTFFDLKMGQFTFCLPDLWREWACSDDVRGFRLPLQVHHAASKQGRLPAAAERQCTCGRFLHGGDSELRIRL